MIITCITYANSFLQTHQHPALFLPSPYRKRIFWEIRMSQWDKVQPPFSAGMGKRVWSKWFPIL
jgi:hypothetical protein